MASGSWNVTTSNNYISGKLSWSSTSNTAGNYSDVTATLRLSRTNTGYTTETRGTFNLSIDGTSYTNTRTAAPLFKFTYNSNTLCITATKRVNHNTNGSKSIAISASFGGTGARFTMSSQGGTATLDTIPRYTSITAFSATVRERNRIDISWSAADTCNYWWYSTNGGSSWVAVGTINASSGSTAITTLSAGTPYSLRVRVRRSDSNLTTDSGTLSRTTWAAATPNTPTTSSTTCISTVVSWSSSRTVTAVQYRIGTNIWTSAISGGSFTARTSGSFTVSGRDPGRAHNVQVQVKDAVTGGWSGWSGNGKFTTVRLTTAGAPTFTTGNSLTVPLSRGSTSISNTVDLQMWADKQEYITIATVEKCTTSVTFNLNEDQLDTIYRNRVGSTRSTVRLRMWQYWGHGGTYQDVSFSTPGTVTIANVGPSLDGVSYVDTNSTVQALIGNNQKLLRNMSTMQVTAGKATSQKYATLRSYKVSIGGSEYSISTSGTSETGKVINVGRINQAANQTATLTVIDSRGYTATKEFTVQVMDYSPPQFIQASADRLNAYEQETTMNIEARRTLVKPSDSDINTLEMRYRIKENPSGTFGGYINLSSTPDPGNDTSVLWKKFLVSQYMADYPSNKSYTIELGIKDTFTDWNTTLITLPEGIALLRFLQDKIIIGRRLDFIQQNTDVGTNRSSELFRLVDTEEDRGWFAFYNKDNETRKGYIGYGRQPKDGHLDIYNDRNDIRLKSVNGGVDIEAINGNTTIASKNIVMSDSRATIYSGLTIDSTAENTLRFPQGRKVNYLGSTGNNADDIVDEWSLVAGTNTPSSGFWYLHTILYASSSQRLQLAYSYNGTNLAYMRHLKGGTWSAWTPLH